MRPSKGARRAGRDAGEAAPPRCPCADALASSAAGAAGGQTGGATRARTWLTTSRAARLCLLRAPEVRAIRCRASRRLLPLILHLGGGTSSGQNCWRCPHEGGHVPHVAICFLPPPPRRRRATVHGERRACTVGCAGGSRHLVRRIHASVTHLDCSLGVSAPPCRVVRRTTMPWSSPQGSARPGRSHSCLAAGPHSRPSAYYDALVRSSLGPLPQAHSAFSSAGVNSTRKLQELACRVLRGVAARRKTTTVEVWGDSHMRNLFSDWLGLDRYASSGEAEIARQRSDCAVPSLSPL